MIKKSPWALVLLATILLLGFSFYVTTPDTEATIDSPAADTLDNTAVVAASITETLPAVSSDSVYRWNDTLYDWIGQRLLDPEKDLQPTTPSGALTAQKGSPIVLEWSTLIDIEYRSEYFAEMDMEMYSPIFGEKLKAVDGQLVEVTGYVIPIVQDGREIALSANPYAACFFCGKASPASVISVILAKPNKRLRTDDFRTIRGRLKLNYDDPNQFYYILKDA